MGPLYSSCFSKWSSKWSMLQRRGSIAEGWTREEIPERRGMNATMAIKNTKETGLLVAGDGTLDKAGVLEQRKNKESQSSLSMRKKSGSIENTSIVLLHPCMEQTVALKSLAEACLISFLVIGLSK